MCPRSSFSTATSVWADDARLDKIIAKNKSINLLILVGDDRIVRIRPAVAEKLPGITHLADLVHIQIRNDQLVFVTRALGHDLPSRIAEIALAVELADVPWGLHTDAIYGSHKISVSDRVGRLFQFPKIFAQSGNCGRGIKDDLGTVKT